MSTWSRLEISHTAVDAAAEQAFHCFYETWFPPRSDCDSGARLTQTFSNLQTEPASEQDALKFDQDALEREGARRMLLVALKAEVDQYVAEHAEYRDEAGRALVVRNGMTEPRRVTTAHRRTGATRPRPVHRRYARVRKTSTTTWPASTGFEREAAEIQDLYLSGRKEELKRWCRRRCCTA